ncbi:MAG: hypothetical protein WBY94_15765 [Polyangiaceae bacterium]
MAPKNLIGSRSPSRRTLLMLFRDRPLVIFLVCAVMFHFANAAMLPLLGEMLAKSRALLYFFMPETRSLRGAAE